MEVYKIKNGSACDNGGVRRIKKKEVQRAEEVGWSTLVEIRNENPNFDSSFLLFTGRFSLHPQAFFCTSKIYYYTLRWKWKWVIYCFVNFSAPPNDFIHISSPVLRFFSVSLVCLQLNFSPIHSLVVLSEL